MEAILAIVRSFRFLLYLTYYSHVINQGNYSNGTDLSPLEWLIDNWKFQKMEFFNKMIQISWCSGFGHAMSKSRYICPFLVQTHDGLQRLPFDANILGKTRAIFRILFPEVTWLQGIWWLYKVDDGVWTVQKLGNHSRLQGEYFCVIRLNCMLWISYSCWSQF